MKRRTFLGSVAAATGVATVSPWFWVPRRSLAATGPLHGRAKHLLILLADGGLRSSALFNADLALRWNPHVDASGSPSQPGAAGTEWSPGAVFSKESIAIPAADDGVMMPALPAISDQISVLTTVDHQPGEENSDVSHLTARRRIATGDYNGTTGLLTRIYKDHPAFATDSPTVFPPVVIGASARLYGVAEPADGGRRPLFFNGPEDFTPRGAVRAYIPQASWAKSLESRLDGRFTAPLSARDSAVVGGYLASKQATTSFRETLRNPMLQLIGGDFEDATLGSNALLRQACGDGPWGGRVALAIRMLQLGSPAVTVGVSGYDTHSNELTDFPPLARDLGRQLAAVHFLLGRLAHPDGGTYLDHTLVTVASEFSRDNTEPQTGLNSANGSDHRGDEGSRNQALPFFGAGLTGGRRIGETDALTMAPKDRAQVFASQAVLATLVDALGLNAARAFREAPLEVLT